MQTSDCVRNNLGRSSCSEISIPFKSFCVKISISFLNHLRENKTYMRENFLSHTRVIYTFVIISMHRWNSQAIRVLA